MKTVNHKAKQGFGAVRHYADGGIIAGIRKMFGRSSPPATPDKAAQQDAQNNAPAAPAQAQAAPPSNNIGQYAGMTALQRREKAAGLARGGMVKKKCVSGGRIAGPGGPTDDLVPIMASNGEFMIKAKSAKVLGPQVLQALNAVGDKRPATAPAAQGTNTRKAAGGMVRRKPVPRLAGGGDVRQNYLDALEAQKAATPSYFDQPTPTSARRQADAAAAADAAYQAMYAKQPAQAAPTAPAVAPAVATAPTAAVAPAPASAGAAANTAANPQAELDAKLGAMPSDLRTTGIEPNKIYKTTQANGTPLYSGYGDGSAASAATPAAPAPADDRYVAPPPASSAMRTRLESLAAQPGKLYINQARALDQLRGQDLQHNSAMQGYGVQRRGQTLQAQSAAAQTASQDKRYADANAIAQSNTNLAGQKQQAEMRAQNAYVSAKTPEEKDAATRQMVALGLLKDGPGDAFVTNVVTNQDGTQSVVATNKHTGQPASGAQGQQKAQPLANHVTALKQNPQLAAQFDAQYGAGASAQYLGKK